tara:strand:- start:339 stop:491 length:153 start_codon:yes stop_codon:yes gene_type:complete
MATYRAEKGIRIPKVSSAPSPLIEGMVWFDTTDGKIYLRKSSTTVTLTAA